MAREREHDKYSILEEVKRLMAEGNEQGAFKFIKTVCTRSWDNDELYLPLFAYNSDYIFNGLIQSNLIYSERILDMIEKYQFNIFPGSQRIIKKAELDCGRLGIEEVYEFASKGNDISKKAVQNCIWTPEWVDKFLAIDDYFLNHMLLTYVDMTFEQFVSALDKDKKRDEEEEREFLEKYPEIKREPKENYPTRNDYARHQIGRFYPLSPEQEATLKPYCEYEIFMHSLKVEPTYEKIITALESEYYAAQGSKKIGSAIEEVELTEIQQLEILKKATEKVKSSDMQIIADGLLANKNISTETIIALCTMSNLQIGVMLLSMFGYGDTDKMLINKIRTMTLTEEQKIEFKKSTILAAFDGVVSREDFTFDDYLDMLKNNCNFTSNGIGQLVSRYVAVPEGDRWRNNRKFNNENELKLAQVGSWLVNHALLGANNPNSDVETLICFASIPLDCGDRYNSTSWGKDKIFMDKIKNTILTDEQFDQLLQTANDFEQPTNPHVIRERDQRPKQEWNEFYKTIPESDRIQYFDDRKMFKIRQNWAINVNTGLIEQKSLSFERLCRILETVKTFKTGVLDDTLNKAINSMVFTIPQLEKMIELGFNFLQPKLNGMRNNPDVAPSPNKLATIDFETQAIELPTGKKPTFYVIDVREGHCDSEGNPLTTKRINLPKQCNNIEFSNEGGSIRIYPSDYTKTGTRFDYRRNSSELLEWNDMDWEYNLDDNTIVDAVMPINISLISKKGQRLALRKKETDN